MTSQKTQGKPIRIFISYAHKDEKFRQKLEEHLSILKRTGYIIEWNDRKITAGKEWANEINTNLESSNAILLLISPAFIASDYCYGIEMNRALERHELGAARVIPIIIKPVIWSDAPFSKLQALPKDAKPITRWRNADDAWADVAEGVRKICQELQTANHSHSNEQGTLTKESKRSESPDQELNLKTFTEFLNSRFPNLVDSERKPSRTLEAANRYGYNTLNDIDRLLQRTEQARTAMSIENKTVFASGEVARAIAFERPAYREEDVWSEEKRTLFEKYEHLLVAK